MPQGRAAVLACVLLAVTSACTDWGRGCTDRGGESGAAFRLSGVTAGRPMPAQATYCVGEVCASGEVRADDDSWHVVVDDGLDGGDVEVSLRVVDAAGSTVVDSRRTVTVQEFRPNGDGCPPTVWHVWVGVRPDGTLQDERRPAGY